MELVIIILVILYVIYNSKTKSGGKHYGDTFVPDREMDEWTQMTANYMHSDEYKNVIKHHSRKSELQNIASMVEEMKIKAEAGNLEAKKTLAELTETSLVERLTIETITGNQESLKKLIEIAQMNDKKAQENLGIIYSYGIGVEKNINESIKWLKEAIEQGSEIAKEMLEDCAWECVD